MGVYNCGEGSGLEMEESESYREMAEEDDEAEDMRIPVSCERDCQPHDQHLTLLTIFIILTIILSMVTIVFLIYSIR